MNAGRLLPFFEVAAPSLSPITDNLSLWIDGRDGLYSTTDYSKLALGTEVNTAYLYDRVTSGYYLQDKTISAFLKCRADSDGILTYISRYNLGGGQAVTGAISNIRTIEFVGSLDTVVTMAISGRNYMLANGSVYLFGRQGFSWRFPEYDVINRLSREIDSGVIHQIVGVIGDDGKARLYIDGLLIATSTFSGFTAFAATDKLLGFSTNNNVSDQIAARVASLRAYTIALTAEQVAQNYAYEQSTGRLS
jgi:hypothetical protein